MKILNELPDEWRKQNGATTAPRGYVWVSNGKSRFGGEYENGLLKITEETNAKDKNRLV